MAEKSAYPAAEGTGPAPRRGRPVQIPTAEREAMVVEATVALLCELPLDRISMADVAARVSMSKRTLYAVFASREALLAAAMARIGDQVFLPLGPGDRALPLEDRLRRLLTLNKLPGLERNSVELLRAVIAAQRRFPDLAARTARSGRRALVGLVAQELAQADRQAEFDLRGVAPAAAGEMLVDMAFQDVIPVLLDPEAGFADVAARTARRDLALAVFLRGFGGGGGARP